MAQKKILIVCGEASGDLNAANLATSLKKINPEIQILAVGGPLLRQAGTQIFYDIKGISVIGIVDALKKLPKFLALKKLVLQRIQTEKPNAIILVDFSGFNLRLAKAINKTIPVIYYVSPQVWASRQGRIESIKKYVHRMIVLFKFEEEFYKKHGIEVDFVGHPLLDTIKPSAKKSETLAQFGLDSSKTIIALLPGSRNAEIKNILPVMLKSAKLINRNLGNAQFLIAKSPQVNLEIYNRLIHGTNLNIKIIEGKTYDCLNVADFALVASGTATLETAVLEKPFVIIYKMSYLNYFLYRPQVKVPFVGIVNIIAGKRIIPEFVQFNAKAGKIAAQVLKTLKDPAEMNHIKAELKQLSSSLGAPGASLRAAQIILDRLSLLPQS